MMESLCYAFGGKGLLFSDDIGLPGDIKPLSDVYNILSFPIREGVGEMEITESGSPDMTRKFLVDDLGGSTSYAEMNGALNSINILNFFLAETESGSGLLSSAIRDGDKKPLQINLKMEKSTAMGETNVTPSSREKSGTSPPESSSPGKRSRNANSCSQLPICQVYGCNKDLSSSKEYHKRHRVCEVHSKTPVVIVNGIEQRFCQQCSRFHVLAEFDEGKRSCRERLAGHNKRRRKLQVDTCLGSSLLGANLSRNSLFLSGILPDSFFSQRRNEPNNCIKLSQEQNQITELAMPMRFYQPHADSLPYPSKSCHNSALSFLELSQSSNSGLECAHSLLSGQSLNLLSNSAGTPIAFPPIFKEHHLATNCQINQKPVKPTSTVFGGQRKELLKVANSAETVNLLELSFHLQRVEQQRHSVQVKRENDFCSVIT